MSQEKERRAVETFIDRRRGSARGKRQRNERQVLARRRSASECWSQRLSGKSSHTTRVASEASLQSMCSHVIRTTSPGDNMLQETMLGGQVGQKANTGQHNGAHCSRHDELAK